LPSWRLTGSTVRTNKKKSFSICFQSTSLRNNSNDLLWTSHSLLFSMINLSAHLWNLNSQQGADLEQRHFLGSPEGLELNESAALGTFVTILSMCASMELLTLMLTNMFCFGNHAKLPIGVLQLPMPTIRDHFGFGWSIAVPSIMYQNWPGNFILLYKYRMVLWHSALQCYTTVALCVGNFLMEGHRFEPQRSKRLSQRSLQCKPSCYHATAGKVHHDYTNHAPPKDPHASLQSKYRPQRSMHGHGRLRHDLIVETHVRSGQPRAYSD